MKLRAIKVLALMGVLTLGPLAASAPAACQVPPPAGAQRQRVELERRLRLGFQRSIQNQLQLDQGKVQSIQGINQSFQTERSALSRAQASLRHRLRDPALQDLDEADATGLLEEMVGLQQQELDLYKREQAELLKVLTPVELVRFYRLRDDLGQRVLEARQGRGQGGVGRGGNGGAAVVPGSRGGGGRFLR
jgi:Spy/CpxP family protein refolding chaperone